MWSCHGGAEEKAARLAGTSPQSSLTISEAEVIKKYIGIISVLIYQLT